MGTRISIQKIHSALNNVQPVSERSVARRATNEKWPCYEKAGKARGGVIREYYVTMLPLDVQNALSATATPVVIPNKAPVAAPALTESLPSLAAYKKKKIFRAQEDKAYAKTELAMAYVQKMKTAGYGEKSKARKIFFESYNMGDAGSMPAVYSLVGAVDVDGKTVNAWVNKLKKNSWDALCLADKRGFCKRGVREITPEQTEIILRIIRSPLNRPGSPVSELLRHAMQVMEQRGINTLSMDSYRRWLMKDWVPYHYDEWTWWKFGEKGLNDKVARSIFRDYDKIEPGDILVADGHVLNFEVINPATGKPKRMILILFFDMKSSYPLGWEIMPTEDTAAISSALRRSIIRLGKIPTIVYIDNGRAFKAKYFTESAEDLELMLKGVYARLGIRLIVAKPYHGQSKTIERFFKTFGELERYAPSFVGECIENKPAHKNRGESIHRRLHKKITQGATPTLEDAHRAIAEWFDRYTNRKQSKNSHLNGQAPADVMIPGPGVDPILLRHLMMSQKQVKVQQNGVYLNKKWYYDQSLYGRTHEVYVRYDLQAQDSVLIYDAKSEELICEAFKTRKVHPAASLLGTDEDRAELQRQITDKASSRKLTVASARAIVDSQVIPEMKRKALSDGFSLNEPIDITPNRTNTRRRKNVKALPVPLSDSEIKRIQNDVAELKELQAESSPVAEIDDYKPEIDTEDFNSDSEDYTPEVETDESIWDQLSEMPEIERLEKLIEMEVQGVLIPSQYNAWMRYFEQTPAYKNQSDYFDEYRTKMVLMWQRSKAV